MCDRVLVGMQFDLFGFESKRYNGLFQVTEVDEEKHLVKLRRIMKTGILSTSTTTNEITLAVEDVLAFDFIGDDSRVFPPIPKSFSGLFEYGSSANLVCVKRKVLKIFEERTEFLNKEMLSMQSDMDAAVSYIKELSDQVANMPDNDWGE
ncbi:MAG: hypothetical protein GY861_21485 [bacterium]|nr:hypothetical protein [bacterium]